MKIKPTELNENIFKLIGDDWMLITAGNKQKANTMTASFGGFGILFSKSVAAIFVRPERYTYNFLEKNDTFSLSFFTEDFRKELTYCGRNSGKDEDKFKKCGFTLSYADDKTPYIDQGRITVICKKIYRQDIKKECFTDTAPFDKTYSEGGMHRVYIGEILEIDIKE